jgi:transcriptional regulator with XRE-family HTH domain
MGFKMNRLKDVAKQLPEREQNELESRYENGDWQLKSSLIALEIHRYLRLNKMKQSELASKMGISSAMVTKLLSGKENLSLKTICGLEKALQIELLRVPSYEKSIVMNYVKPSIAASGMKFSEEEGSESYE